MDDLPTFLSMVEENLGRRTYLYEQRFVGMMFARGDASEQTASKVALLIDRNSASFESIFKENSDDGTE